MNSQNLVRLANFVKDDDPNAAIVLFVLAGAKVLGNDAALAEYCQKFARESLEYTKYLRENE